MLKFKKLTILFFVTTLLGSVIFTYDSAGELAALVLICVAFAYVFDALMRWMMS